MVSRDQFRGSCKIRVSNVPQQPATEHDYAIRCLSQNNGVLSGRVTDGVFRIALHPQIEDNAIYLEGRVEGASFRGKWFYQSFAGYNECGAFEARVDTKSP